MQTLAPSVPANTAFRVWKFVADPPILDLVSGSEQQGQLVLYGATDKTYRIESATNLNTGATWQPGDTAEMTNTFRIFPTFPMADPVRFFRAKEIH